MAQQSSVPESVLKVNIFICIICFKCQPTQVFEDAIADAENGLTGWLTYVNSYRIVRLMTYPARLPISVAKVYQITYFVLYLKLNPQNFVSRLTGLLPTLDEDSLCRKAVEILIEQLYKYVAQGGYWLSPKNHTAR